MNKKKILVLSLVLVVLIGLLILVMAMPDKNNVTDPAQSDGNVSIKEEVLFTTPIDDVTFIKVSYGGDVYSLKRTEDGWVCPEKPKVHLSSTRISRLLTELSSVRYTEAIKVDDKTKLSEYGIFANRDYIQFNKGTEVMAVYRGNDVVDSGLCYIMIDESEDVYMVNRERVSLMFAPFDEYRNESLQIVDFEKITDIELSNENGSFKMRKTTSDMNKGIYYSWNVISPVSVQARDTEVESYLITPVKEMAINAYVSDDGDFSKYGIDKSKYISFADENGKKQTIYFSAPLNNKYYVSLDLSESIYEILPSSMNFAKVNLIDVADRQLFLAKQDNISSLSISGNGKDYKVDFNEGGTVSVNSNLVSDKAKARDIFSSVCGLFADDVGLQTSGNPIFTMTFKLKNSNSVTLEFSEKNDRYYTVSKNGKAMYTIQKNKLNSMFDMLDKYKG